MGSHGRESVQSRVLCMFTVRSDVYSERLNIV